MVFANYDVACAIALLFLYVPRENLVEKLIVANFAH